jgi:hypothetical protein
VKGSIVIETQFARWKPIVSTQIGVESTREHIQQPGPPAIPTPFIRGVSILAPGPTARQRHEAVTAPPIHLIAGCRADILIFEIEPANDP